MIKCNDLTTETLEIVEQCGRLVSSFRDGADINKFAIIFKELEGLSEFSKICRRWNNSNKIRIWYKRKVDAATEEIKKKAEEKLKQEEEQKKAEDELKKAEQKPEEENKEEGKEEELKEGDTEEPNEETIDTTTGAEKEKEVSKVDVAKIQKELDMVKGKLVKAQVEKAGLIIKLVTPIYWDQREQERKKVLISMQSNSGAPSRHSSKKVMLPRKMRRRQTSMFMDKLTKKDVFDSCQSSVLSYFKLDLTYKEILERLEEVYL